MRVVYTADDHWQKLWRAHDVDKAFDQYRYHVTYRNYANIVTKQPTIARSTSSLRYLLATPTSSPSNLL